MDAIILAAGEGKRMKSEIPKVLHKICGKTMLEHVINSCISAGIDKIAVVVGHKADMIKRNISGVDFIFQDKQLGTGHAVMCAKEFFADKKDILILNGDMPLISAETLKKLISVHKTNAVTLISTIIENPSGYGRIVRYENKFSKIVEDKDASQKEILIKEINTGVYLFNSDMLKTALQFLENKNSQGEYYLTDTIEIIKSINDQTEILCVDNPQEFLGVNDRVQLAHVSCLIQKKINNYHMQNGVTIINPEQTYIDHGIEIGRDTVIYPNTFIESKSKIGTNCIIGTSTRIVNSKIHDSVDIQNSVIINSEIKSNSRIGPFAYIRPDCIVGENVKIGDFVEVKNSNIGDNTKVSHLTYVGDSDVGQSINFGCGTVTVNYDGNKKFRTKIDDGAFIGCNTNLIAPVNIGKNSYIAAGSTITKDVPESSLAIAREYQINKHNWHKKNNN